MNDNIQSQPLFTDDPAATVNNSTNAQQTGQPANPQQALIDNLQKQREKWTSDIEELNGLMKDMPSVDELLNQVYMKRQSAVDYYYTMNTVILNQTKGYKKLYNDMFNNIKINGYNGIRFTSDQCISRQVESELQDRKEIIDLLTNQNSFIKDTISTIDNIIYGINQKVKVKELLNGLKF